MCQDKKYVQTFQVTCHSKARTQNFVFNDVFPMVFNSVTNSAIGLNNFKLVRIVHRNTVKILLTRTNEFQIIACEAQLFICGEMWSRILEVLIS